MQRRFGGKIFLNETEEALKIYFIVWISFYPQAKEPELIICDGKSGLTKCSPYDGLVLWVQSHGIGWPWGHRKALGALCKAHCELKFWNSNSSSPHAGFRFGLSAPSLSCNGLAAIRGQRAPTGLGSLTRPQTLLCCSLSVGHLF